MTESEWLACDVADRMLSHLGITETSRRKVRLFAGACCRRVLHLAEPAAREWVELAERYADGLLSAEELEAACDASYDLPGSVAEGACSGAMIDDWSGHLPADTLQSAAMAAGNAAAYPVTDPTDDTWAAAYAREREAQADLFRDVFGNPFRPVTVAAAWLALNGGVVPALARAIYEERAFDRLPVLADALEEAGCDSAELLGHLRGPGPHVRGCWAVDLLLGKG